MREGVPVGLSVSVPPVRTEGPGLVRGSGVGQGEGRGVPGGGGVPGAGRGPPSYTELPRPSGLATTPSVHCVSAVGCHHSVHWAAAHH